MKYFLSGTLMTGDVAARKFPLTDKGDVSGAIPSRSANYFFALTRSQDFPGWVQQTAL
jgi:hypothetical protein